jgi:hypothetical protein
MININDIIIKYINRTVSITAYLLMILAMAESGDSNPRKEFWPLQRFSKRNCPRPCCLDSITYCGSGARFRAENALLGNNCAATVLQRRTNEAGLEGPLPRNFRQTRLASQVPVRHQQVVAARMFHQSAHSSSPAATASWFRPVRCHSITGCILRAGRHALYPRFERSTAQFRFSRSRTGLSSQ